MSTDNAKLVMELDRQLAAAALARMDEAASSALMADDIVWAHVNARKTDNKEAVFEPWRRGEGSYTSIERYDVTARDYGTFVVVTGSSRIDCAYQGTRFLLDCRFTDVWGDIGGKVANGGPTRHKQTGLTRASPYTRDRTAELSR